MDKYLNFFTKGAFRRHCNIKLTACRPGYATATVEIGEEHFNTIGVVHGGLIFTIADYCLGVAAIAYGKKTLTINSQMSFFHPCTGGILTAEAKEIAKSNKLQTYDVNVYDDTGRLIANGKGTVYITKEDVVFE